MKNQLVAILACVAFSFTGCETVRNLYAKPETKAVIDAAKEAAFAATSAAAGEAVRQLSTGQQVNGAKIAMVSGAAALYTAANYVRQLQATKAVLDEKATAAHLAAAGIPPAEASTLAGEITATARSLTAKGVPPDVASEINASAFDARAKAIQEGK